MRLLRGLVVAVVFFCPTYSALCCSCSFGPPIQKTSERERERAVFTARVVQPLGRIYNWDGKQLSDMVLAVVHERFWGVPWNWPKTVILNGSYPCDTAMAIGEEYLVSGSPERYGVFSVNGCSRTRPLKEAQVDLRTPDGSRCAGPGGTVIGYVRKGNDPFRGEHAIAPDVSVNLRDQDGKTYTAQSDAEGIYELRHVPPGVYAVESDVSQNQYASSSGIAAVEGECREMGILLRDYAVRGRLLPGLTASIELVGIEELPKQIPSDSIEPDGRFYFRHVPDGEYLLSVTTWIEGTARNLYYPGTNDRQKAARLRITNQTLVGGGTLDFNPEKLPMVPIPVSLDPSTSDRFTWRVQLLRSGQVMTEGTWAPGGRQILLYGTRGASYGLVLYGYSNRPLEYKDCRAEIAAVVAKPGMEAVRVAVPAGCQ